MKQYLKDDELLCKVIKMRLQNKAYIKYGFFFLVCINCDINMNALCLSDMTYSYLCIVLNLNCEIVHFIIDSYVSIHDLG